MPFLMVGMGMLCMWLALTLFGEYRKAFMADPVAVMSLDVLMTILRCGAPGYIALIALFGGALLGGSGLLFLAWLLATESKTLWRALALTLGL